MSAPTWLLAMDLEVAAKCHARRWSRLYLEHTGDCQAQTAGRLLQGPTAPWSLPGLALFSLGYRPDARVRAMTTHCASTTSFAAANLAGYNAIPSPLLAVTHVSSLVGKTRWPASGGGSGRVRLRSGCRERKRLF